MKLEILNSYFRKFGEFQIKNRWKFLCAILIFTLAGFAGLTKLKVSSGEDGFFDNSDAVKRAQDYFEDVFGNEDSVLVLVQADDVFDPVVLNAIDRLSQRLETEIPFANEITSLTNLSITKGVEDGFEIVNPFDQIDVSDPQSIETQRAFILSRNSLLNNLISDDCKETWVKLSLTPYQDDSEDMLKVGKACYEIVNSQEFKNPKYTLKPTGMAYTEYMEDTVTSKECIKRIAIGFVIMVLCLIFFIRSVRGLIVPALATLGGIGSVLGYSSWMNITANSTLLVLPVVLGMALSVGYSIHFINEFRLHFKQKGKRIESVIDAIEECGWPILFTVITTVASLISFMLTGIGAIRWVGGICASIVFVTYLYVIILIPIFMSFGKDKEVTKEDNKSEKNITKAELVFEKLAKKVIKGKWYVLCTGIILVAITIPGLLRMSVNMDYMETMGKKIPYIKELMSILDAKLGNQYSYNVMIEFSEEDAFKNPENMENLDKLKEQLSGLKLTRFSGDSARITSVTDIVKEINRSLNEDKIEYYKIPENQELLTQELFMYEISGGENLSSWLDYDYKTTYVHVDLNGYNAKLMVEDIENAKRFANELFPQAKISIVGEVVNYAAMNEKLVKGELKSFLSSFIVIAILMMLAFKSIKTGLIGMIPNIAPVLFIGAVMGYKNMPLDMITMTVMPMILGIAVDDTIHFTNRVKLEYERTKNYKESLIICFREIGKTLGMTTFILCAMFAVFISSPMTALSRIGILTIVGLGSALIADYTLTPVLLYLSKPFGGKNEE